MGKNISILFRKENMRTALNALSYTTYYVILAILQWARDAKLIFGPRT